MFLEDTLSRAPLPSTCLSNNSLRLEHEEVCRVVELENVKVAGFLRISNEGLENIQPLTEDSQLQELKKTVLKGDQKQYKKLSKVLVNTGHTVMKSWCCAVQGRSSDYSYVSA